MDPMAFERPWPDGELGPYTLRLWFKPLGGQARVVGVELWGTEPVSGRPWSSVPAAETAITAKTVRLPLGELLDQWIDQARKFIEAQAAIAKMMGTPAGAEELRKLGFPAMQVNEESRRDAQQLIAVQRGRPPKLTDAFLRRVADIYLDAKTSEHHRKPAAVVQKRLGAATPSTARSWIHQARKRGFIQEGQ